MQPSTGERLNCLTARCLYMQTLLADENRGDGPRRGRGGATAPATGRDRRKETDRLASTE